MAAAAAAAAAPLAPPPRATLASLILKIRPITARLDMEEYNDVPERLNMMDGILDCDPTGEARPKALAVRVTCKGTRTYLEADATPHDCCVAACTALIHAQCMFSDCTAFTVGILDDTMKNIRELIRTKAIRTRATSASQKLGFHALRRYIFAASCDALRMLQPQADVEACWNQGKMPHGRFAEKLHALTAARRFPVFGDEFAVVSSLMGNLFDMGEFLNEAYKNFLHWLNKEQYDVSAIYAEAEAVYAQDYCSELDRVDEGDEIRGSDTEGEGESDGEGEEDGGEEEEAEEEAEEEEGGDKRRRDTPAEGRKRAKGSDATP